MMILRKTNLFKHFLVLLVIVTCICVLIFQRKENPGKHLWETTKNIGYSNTESGLENTLHDPAAIGSRESPESGLQSSGNPESIRARFVQRSHLLTQMCSLPRHQLATMTNRVEPNVLNLTDGQLNLCLIPKVGTTFTKYHMELRISGQEIELKSETPKSYIVVREPYSRLVSGYLDKIVTNVRWWRKYGQLIISKFRSGASEKSIQCGNGVTFPEFVKYIIYSQNASKDLNPHFQPMHQQCHICHQHYDFIGHLETLADDLSFIMKSVNIVVDDVDFDISESDIREKCEVAIRYRKKSERCQDMCTTMSAIWWSLQARGLIFKDIKLPVNGTGCDSLSRAEFIELGLSAYKESLGKISKSEQKRNFLVELFTQVPLQDRLLLREIFMADFEIFGYDSMPSDLFPEIYLQK